MTEGNEESSQAESAESVTGRSIQESTAGSAKTHETVSAARRLIAHDSKWIRRSKLFVLLVVFVAAVATSIGAYVYGRRVEEDDFEVRFRDFGQQVLSVSQINADNIFKVYETLSETMTAMELTMDATWPYVLFPEYEAMAFGSMQKTGANWVAYTPIVQRSQRRAYEEYSVANQEGWIQRALDYRGLDMNVSIVVDYIHCMDSNLTNGPFDFVPCPDAEDFHPIAQMSPIEMVTPLLNFDGMNFPFFKIAYHGMIQVNEAVLSHVLNLEEAATWEEYWPVSFMASPVFDRVGHVGEKVPGEVVAVVSAEIPWHSYFQNLIPEGVDGVVLVVENTCNQTFSYIINGPQVAYLGVGDKHDSSFEYLALTEDFTAFKSIPACQYSFSVYPTETFKDEYMTTTPIYSALATLAIFLLTGIVFFIYDQFVQMRQKKLLSSAERTSAIVNSLFPENVRGRLIDDAVVIANGHQARTDPSGHFDLPDLCQSELIRTTKPIADLFPKATVLFADLVGFTAWSSIREPSQVFTLLETVYSSFDKLAKKLRVFKVETIGDCYVAATGLPDPRRDHAVAMARFARLCLEKLDEVVLDLQYTLGPGTSELAIRIGIHSGPVTAGVLRGEKSRFQLFGDTVNTAARMESTGERNRIQVSQQTARILEKAGKEEWLEERNDLVVAKGKGHLQTFWLTSRDTLSSQHGIEQPSGWLLQNHVDNGGSALPSSVQTKDKVMDALIGWNTDFLLQLLKKVVAGRGQDAIVDVDEVDKLALESSPEKNVLDEMVDDVSLPAAPSGPSVEPESVHIKVGVVEQLHDFVQTIASMHTPGVPYHSFEHSSHVCQSVAKLLGRMLGPDEVDYTNMTYMKSRGALALHEETYGIASDPLTQFVCGFAALVHDVDHPGVSNEVLVEEKSNLANLYGDRCVAKQNSVEVAWGLLMESRYRDLRACIYTTQEELERFRCLVVNTVVSTDVWNTGVMTSQVAKWQAAFGSQPESPETAQVGTVKRKAMAVVENLLAASDHSHAMQHWIVYIKWNELMFDEMYSAYRSGRSSVDPSVTWYKDELDFFSTRIIPLAENLQVCGVFGTACDEYLDYALMNQKEWEQKGQHMVDQFVLKYPKDVREEENVYDIF